MLLITGTVRLPAGGLDRARAAMEKMVASSRAEDGCFTYAYAQDVFDPTLIHVVERWRDREALKAHGASPHMAEWRAAAGDIGLHDRDLKVYEADDGTPL
jgi:quinol monooxygenase YgiN